MKESNKFEFWLDTITLIAKLAFIISVCFELTSLESANRENKTKIEKLYKIVQSVCPEEVEKIEETKK